MRRREIMTVGGAALAASLSTRSAAAAISAALVRIAELRIAPEHLEAYTREYFDTTKHMITARKLIDTIPIQLSAKD